MGRSIYSSKDWEQYCICHRWITVKEFNITQVLPMAQKSKENHHKHSLNKLEGNVQLIPQPQVDITTIPRRNCTKVRSQIPMQSKPRHNRSREKWETREKNICERTLKRCSKWFEYMRRNIYICNKKPGILNERYKARFILRGYRKGLHNSDIMDDQIQKKLKYTFQQR